MNDTRRKYGPNQLHPSTVRVSEAAAAFIDRMVATRGHTATARNLGLAPTTLDRVRGPGVQPATRDRVEERVRALQTG